MSCGACSSEEVCECDFMQDSKQRKGKGRAVSVSLPIALNHRIFVEHAALQKEIRENLLYNNISHPLKARMAFFLSVGLSSVGSIKPFNPEGTDLLLRYILESLNMILLQLSSFSSTRASWLSFTPM